MSNVAKLSSSATFVYARMRDEIVFGLRRPRERLIESDLVIQFNSNRAAVREALTRLEIDGLVQRTPNRGAAVPDLKPAEVERLYDVRICIETAAIHRLRFPLSAQVVDRLIDIQNRHTEAVGAADRRTIFLTNNDFHREIYLQCENTYLLEMIDLMANRALLVRFHSYQNPEFLEIVCREHWKMIDAIKARDKKGLAELVAIHVPRAKEGYLAAYRERESMEAVR